MNSSFCSFSRRPKEAAEPQKYRWLRALEIAEFGPASVCSYILWKYARELEALTDTDHVNDGQVGSPVPPKFLGQPTPKLVLVAALGFGCCVSSFAHRRQKDEPFQVLVFALLAGTVATVAYGFGARLRMILLGYMPFSTCAAMVASTCCHIMFLRLVRREEETEVGNQEKV